MKRAHIGRSGKLVHLCQTNHEGQFLNLIYNWADMSTHNLIVKSSVDRDNQLYDGF